MLECDALNGPLQRHLQQVRPPAKWMAAGHLHPCIHRAVGTVGDVRANHLSCRTHTHTLSSLRELFRQRSYRFTLLGAGLGAGYFCVRLLENLPWRSLGLTMHQRWVRDLIVGTAIGVAAVAFAVAIATAAGGLQFTFIGNEMLLAAGRSLLTAGVLLFVAALAEEAAFRGYPLQTLTRAGLMWLGVILTSVPFGFAHLWNPNVVPGITFANTVIAGFWLAAAYLKTRSLWFPLGVHWGWNWALGSIFGLPISGVRFFSNPILRGQDVGPAWLTGGNYGIEGGVAGTAALIAFTLLIWRTRLVTPTQELLKLTSEENPATTPRVSIRS